MSFSMIGSAGFLLMVGLVINSLTDILSTTGWSAHFPKDAFWLFYASNVILLYHHYYNLLHIVFKTLPDGKIVLPDCLIGASFTASLFMIGKFAIGAFLGSSLFASIYGAVGSAILILIWVYYSAIILYLAPSLRRYMRTPTDKKLFPMSIRLKY